ncbi:MAG: hypothetical protein Q7I95_06985, partial [Thiobacillus sp.]|nr:hypothetical protein [Thiobacillus sp.]
AALDRIIGNDQTLRPFLGLSPDSPVPTPAVTAEGVPLQGWDFYGSFLLLSRATATDVPELASPADIEEMISKDLFKLNLDNVPSLLLGDRKLFGNGFDNLLLSLSLVPASSVRVLNIIAHCTSIFRLDFAVDFIYTKGSEFIDHALRETPQRPFQNVDMGELTTLLATPEINVNGVAVKLSEVRKAFPVDAEVHVFNMSNPLREDFLQAIANVFQVRTSGFTQKPVRIQATLVGESEGGEAILSKKIDIGFIGDPVTTQVDFFAHLLQEDRVRTGLFTAFPRRG